MYQATREATKPLFYYAPELCAWCIGIGFVDGACCLTCGGAGSVITSQPGLKCAACEGSGSSVALFGSVTKERCKVCGGSGWLTRNMG